MVRQLRSSTNMAKEGMGKVEEESPNKRTRKHKRSDSLNDEPSPKRKPSTLKAKEPARTTKSIKVENKETKPAKSKATPKTKKAVILGQDPYPNYPFPTPEQCQIVHDLLTEAHGPAKRPKAVPVASAIHAGCGEVPSVLDALMRTLLSANTSAKNSSRAFRGLLAKYGSDPAHGGANWEAVRKGSAKDIFKAIEKGGLANVKSKAMKNILDEVYEEGKTNGYGLSLDYLHEKTDEEAMSKLTGFKGIGVKTATCVLMFCLRRSAFPVDTHVFRISKLLGWVPTPQSQREDMEKESKKAPLELSDDDLEAESDEGKKGIKQKKPPNNRMKKPPPVTRDTTFLHLDAKIPEELKYGLHQLLIRHGRYCPTCNAMGGRKYGIGQSGKPIVGKVKEVTVKEENPDGTFNETQMEVTVKEEQSDDEDGVDMGLGDETAISNAIKTEEDVEGTDKRKYVPIDAAGGTGERTGGNADGSCILGDMISWERLV